MEPVFGPLGCQEGVDSFLPLTGEKTSGMAPREWSRVVRKVFEKCEANVAEKTCIVTGANSGVGFEAVRLLAESGARVILVCRDKGRGETALARIQEAAPAAELRLEVTDLASLSQVRALGAKLSDGLSMVDLLINNAGVYRATLEKTEDGFERTMGVNHLSHFLLTHLLLPRLLECGGRVINVSSEAHRRGRLDSRSLRESLTGPARFSGMLAYSNSKLANILFTKELSRRFPPDRLSTCAMHPGVLATQIWNQNRNLASLLMVLLKPVMGRPSVGGSALAHLSNEPAQGIHGLYFDRKKEAWPSPLARDESLARRLWDLSWELTELK